MYKRRLKRLALMLVVILVTVLSGTMLLSKKTFKASAASEPIFTDVPADHPFFNQIQEVFGANIMTGLETREFRPDLTADRATVSYVLARAYGISIVPPAVPTFSDVPTTHWAYKEIENLYLGGYVSGFPDGTFHPDLPDGAVDRQSVAAFFAKIHSGGTVPSDPDNTPHFSDCVNVLTCWAYNSVEYLASLDPPVISGYNDGTFHPNDPATRSTLAVVLAKDRNLDISNPPTNPSFTDVPTTNTSFSYIETVHEAGLMNGYLISREFRPDGDVDRATTAVAVARATNNYYEPNLQTFTDVSRTHWAYKEIEGLNKAGIMTGFDMGNGQKEFRPNLAFDRRSMAIVLARAKQLDLTNPGKTFNDVPITDPGYLEIEAAYRANITNGCSAPIGQSGLYFCPDGLLTRGELAVFMYNAYLTLTFYKQADKSSALPDEIITYTISYRNETDTTYQNAEIRDIVPSGTTYVEGSASNNGAYWSSYGVVIWEIGTLLSGDAGRGVLTFQVRVN